MRRGPRFAELTLGNKQQERNHRERPRHPRIVSTQPNRRCFPPTRSRQSTRWTAHSLPCRCHLVARILRRRSDSDPAHIPGCGDRGRADDLQEAASRSRNPRLPPGRSSGAWRRRLNCIAPRVARRQAVTRYKGTTTGRHRDLKNGEDSMASSILTLTRFR